MTVQDSRASGSLRYERKFQADGLDVHQVRALVRVHPSMFVQAFPPRYVNNLYLDSKELEGYFANLDGAEGRQKARVRWYGDPFGPIEHPILEFKKKRGWVGFKEQHPVAPFVLERGFSQRYFQEVLRRCDLPDGVRVRLQGLEVVLFNRYFRWYYASMDGRFRITVDTGMLFCGVANLSSTFIHRQEDRGRVVVELKYGVAHDHCAHRVAAFFPFRVSRNSKYVQGIESVYL